MDKKQRDWIKIMKTNGENQDLQRLMNARLWECVEDYGGAQDISKATGLSPQTFYNMRDNRTFPSTPTIKEVKRVVPSLSYDALYSDRETTQWKIIAGEITRPEPPTPTTPGDAVNWKEMYLDLSGRYNEMESNFKVLVEQVKGLTMQNQMLEFMYKKLDPSFYSASSQTTAAFDIDDIIAQYKFSVQKMIRESFRIDGLEPTKVREERMLNSRDSETIIRELWAPEPVAMSA